jgi:hypothetical protein
LLNTRSALSEIRELRPRSRTERSAVRSSFFKGIPLKTEMWLANYYF